MATTLSLLRFAPLPPRLTRSSLTINITPSGLSPNRSVRIRPCVLPISTSTTVPAIDSIISIAAYTLPFINALPYGRILQSRCPLLSSPFFSKLLAYELGPLLEFMAFYFLYFGLAQNPSMTRFVRLNAMQAVHLNTILNFVFIVQRLLGTPANRDFEFSRGAIFVVGFVIFVYCVLCCFVGHTPYLPLLSSFADLVLY